MKTLGSLLLIAAFAASAGAQTFDVASVKPNKAGNAGGEGGERETITVDPGSLIMRNVTLKSCIRWAYGLEAYQISGPTWIGSQRFDILGKPGKPANREQMSAMLRTLLSSRFALTVHREMRDLPVYELAVGREGPKLKPAQGEGESRMQPGDGDLTFVHYSMAELAEKLPGIPFRVDRTVVDKTGLSGTYDFKLKIADNAAEMKRGFEHSDGPLVSDVLKQIGLRLDARRDPVEILVIDSADKTPSEN